jgi:cell division protein FtsA
MKDFVLVFDIGSSKLRAMVAGKGVNDTFITKGYVEADYEGFYEGRFLNPEKLAQVFKQALSDLDFDNSKNKKVYIGVPAEFSSVIATSASMNFGDRRKIKQSDIEAMFYSASEKAKGEGVEILSVNPISFTIDDARLSYSPIGEMASSLSAKLSIIYVGREFISLFNSIIAGFGFESVEYMSEPLCEALFVISKEEREDLNLFIDVGDLTTSVSIVKGEGLAHLSSFSIGGAFITNSLSEAFDLTLSEADRLKKMVVLSLKGKSTDFYELTTDLGKVIKIPLNQANEVVGYIIDTIGSAISKCLQLFSSDYIPFLPVYLSGGGVTKIKGGRDYLAKCLGRNISYGVPRLPGKDKPTLASIYSLVSSALKS